MLPATVDDDRFIDVGAINERPDLVVWLGAQEICIVVGIESNVVGAWFCDGFELFFPVEVAEFDECHCGLLFVLRAAPFAACWQSVKSPMPEAPAPRSQLKIGGYLQGGTDFRLYRPGGAFSLPDRNRKALTLRRSRALKFHTKEPGLA